MDVASSRHTSALAGKVIFADQLRAIAALSVMIVHLLGVYWAAREAVARHIAAPVLTGSSARTQDLVSFPHFDFGPFGVGLFFLVSGFVIPFSLAKTTRLRFLAARALRIYPTYLACLLLGLVIVWLSAMFWKTDYVWGWRHVIANATLTNSVLAVESIDMVNWTLAVEIKFYLIACLAAGWIGRGRVVPVLAISFAVMCGVLVQAHLIPVAWQQISLGIATVQLAFVAHDLHFIPFLFAGTMFSYHFRGQIGARRLLVCVSLLVAMFAFTLRHTLLKGFFPAIPLNYFFALCVFSLAYCLRDRCRPSKIVDWFASISYPVYALHPLVGYTTIRYLMAVGVDYYLALPAAVALVLGSAYAVHCLVELPTQNIGKRLMAMAPANGRAADTSAPVAASIRSG